jgi:thiol-disulfide isomerase/thioredoxin
MNYKLWWFFSFLFLSIVSSSQSINQRQVDSIVNAWHKRVLDKPLSNFIAAGSDGIVNNDSLKGKVTFINMWEEHCAPCMAEMETLNKLYDTLRYNPDFQFISISSDSPEVIEKIKANYHIQYNVYHLDMEGCFQLNGGMGYPTYLILDAKSLVKSAYAGGATDEISIRHFIFYTGIYPEIMKELH